MVEVNDLQKILDKLRTLELEFKKTNMDYDINGKRVPRVTEVLSAMLHEDSLMNWANGLGWKRISYRAFMRTAADKGTYSHLAIERFLRDGYIKVGNMGIRDPKIEATIISVMNGFVDWWDTINENNDVDVVFLEEQLIDDYFGGTCDCVLKVNDEYWLIDFKTSNHMSYNYALQLAAYRYLLLKLKGIKVSKSMVLKLDKENRSYETYEFDLKNPDTIKFMDECLECFMLLTAAYMSRLHTYKKYKEYF